MITVMLYGFLGKQFGKVHRYEVSSVAEAVRALSANFEGFREALVNGGAYRVSVAGKEDLNQAQIGLPVSERETIRLVPTVAGSGGAVRIVLGAVLVALSFIPGFQFLAPIGISLILGGVSELLFAPKKQDTGVHKVENKPSFSFDGAENTAMQGNPVQLCYGKVLVGSQVISAGLSAHELSPAPGSAYSATSILAVGGK